ncbi:MAG TPA: hypothetical protein VL651_14615, partial [Bacteroidia bacterium]|nr:hypothetical protein [Bacteroidia bacterium]
EQKNDFPLIVLTGIIRERVIYEGTPQEHLGYVLDLPDEELRIKKGTFDSGTSGQDVAPFVNKTVHVTGHRFLSVFFVKEITPGQNQ